MPPLKKRKIRSDVSVSANAAKIQTLEKVVYRRNFGEIKTLTGHLPSTQVVNGGSNVQILTGIATGPNQGQRIGNELRVRSIEIAGDVGNFGVDIYLVQSRTGNPPTIANFTPTYGGMLTQGTSQEHFAIVAQALNTDNTSAIFRMKKSYSIPMKVSYTGPTATELSTNHLYVVVINRTGSNHNIQWSFTLKYID